LVVLFVNKEGPAVSSAKLINLYLTNSPYHGYLLLAFVSILSTGKSVRRVARSSHSIKLKLCPFIFAQHKKNKDAGGREQEEKKDSSDIIQLMDSLCQNWPASAPATALHLSTFCVCTTYYYTARVILRHFRFCYWSVDDILCVYGCVAWWFVWYAGRGIAGFSRRTINKTHTFL
jgi:hypothetical protein